MFSKNIVLIGFMGTGKTSVGKILAKKLGCEVTDVDQFIEAQEKRKIRDIFEKEGETYFRKLERNAIAEILKAQGQIVTTGGGAVLDADNRAAFKQNHVVALSATPQTIFERVRHSQHRPLLKGNDDVAEIKKLLSKRQFFYAEAEYQFNTDGLTAAQVSGAILKALEAKQLV